MLSSFFRAVGLLMYPEDGDSRSLQKNGIICP